LSSNVNERKPLMLGRGLKASDNIMKFCVHGGDLNKTLAASIMGRGLHSSTFRLNLSASYDRGGTFEVCLGGV